jgi:hypothetical protein
LHAVKPDDKPRRPTFAADILQRIEIDDNFLAKVLFSDEATFHLSGMVNKHNMVLNILERSWSINGTFPRSTCGVD